jgi:hypothetical protein
MSVNAMVAQLVPAAAAVHSLSIEQFHIRFRD